MFLIAILALLLLMALLGMALRAARMGPPEWLAAPNLGSMSQQWIAEYRATHSS